MQANGLPNSVRLVRNPGHNQTAPEEPVALLGQAEPLTRHHRDLDRGGKLPNLQAITVPG